MSRENADFGRDLPRLADVGPPALTGVLALGVFADDHPVKVARASIAQGRRDAAEEFGGANIGVLLEGLADGEAEGPEGDVVWDVCWERLCLVGWFRR